MAKAFYTQDEAKAALNTDDDGLKSLVHDGRLTEYRDGANLMYKGSQVEQVAADLGSGDDIGLSDTGGPIGLADSSGGSGVAMSDSRRRAPEPSMASDDTGSFALTDTGTQSGSSQSGTFSPGASASGITIFEDDDVDPSAQTNIAGGSSDQVNLEGIGSGSGLLDLTQEPDDTSFGAETFDEIMPEGSVAGGTVAGLDEDSMIDTGVSPAGTRAVGVMYETVDPMAPVFGGLAAGAAMFVLLGLLAVALAALRSSPGVLDMFYTSGANGGSDVNMPILLAAALGLPLIGAIIGFVGGKMATN